ncbi:dopey [Verticillium dahliae VdLs.17]|uniref:Dopey n=3 Tax=Verticillium TaxID=1036719 RepID=G2X021_VERDV|nr:dopey [Verticillium dahliae VdLs.17]EGY21604.1 dopey [Verticillium dahliae VdLs.17]
MANEPASSRRSLSPESSGRDSPLPTRQWRNQLGSAAEDAPSNDKAYRKYASGVERALTLFETALQEWADYISFLNRLLRALQARHNSITTVPSKAAVAKRLAQCLNPSLPSGVHQKALEVYNYVFTTIGQDGLARDLSLYLPGLASTLSFASLSVRAPYLDILETHFLRLDPRSLRPAMKSIVLALLPGLEEETSEDFDRTMKLMESFKVAIRSPGSEELTDVHSTGDDFFWQCFFLASITSHSRRGGALAYLVRTLPKLGEPISSAPPKDDGTNNGDQADLFNQLGRIVTSPEPGLLLRCFAAGLADEQLLIQRGFLDLLVTHLPLHSKVLQTRVKPADLELLLRAASGVVIRRDMSLNRRLWAWFLGPDPPAADNESTVESPLSVEHPQSYLTSKTSYFEDHGLHSLTQALLAMIQASSDASPTERARPYRICLSLMDRWEIGGLVVPEVFLPIVDSVRQYKGQSSNKNDFNEVFKSASVFFDGVESGLIYGEMVSLLAQAIGPSSLSTAQRLDKLDLVTFILANFNIREEEMITIHAPLTALSILCMLEDAQDRQNNPDQATLRLEAVTERILEIALSLFDLIPERAFPTQDKPARTMEAAVLVSLPVIELLKRIKAFYVNDQGSLDAANAPFTPVEVGELLVRKSGRLICEGLSTTSLELGTKGRLLTALLVKTSVRYDLDTAQILSCLHARLAQDTSLPFSSFSSVVHLSSHLYFAKRTSLEDLADLVAPIVRHAWTYLAVSEPKYHVETVRLLWQLQSVLSPQSRDIEAALSKLITEKDTQGAFAARRADPGRRFTVLWSHTLNDSQSDRRGSRTPTLERLPLPRLSGADHYDVMLTRPLLLMLDALLDERTQLFMTVKSWLNSLVGIDKLFLVFVAKFSAMSFLGARRSAGGNAGTDRSAAFSDDDDLDTCLYYLRTLSNVFRWAPDAIWSILVSSTLNHNASRPEIARIVGREGDVSLQEFFLQILLNPYAESLSSLHLEEPLIERLSQALTGPDPYVQVLLLDVVFATLKIRHHVSPELPTSPTSEKGKLSVEPNRGPRSSMQHEAGPRILSPPPSLLKCLQSGLSATSSRSVLDSWVSFLTECLPLYSETIFQVLIPLVETLCKQVSATFDNLQTTFRDAHSVASDEWNAPESTLISLLNALEQVLARGHERLLAEEARTQVVKGPDQQQGFFGNMVSGVFASDGSHSRSVTANDRLTVHLAFQDAVRICFTIWSWGQGADVRAQDITSVSSFNYTSLRMRNRARRLLEHLFAAETLECLETAIGIWRASIEASAAAQQSEVFKLLPALDGSRPRHTIPAIFNAIYSRTNPQALEPARRSTLTISLQDTDLVTFLVEYARSLEDDAMDEIWQDCMAFLRDLLANPFPHRQTLPSLLEFAAILGEKVDNTNFGEQRKMRRELGDLFLRLLTAIFTTKPMSFADTASDKGDKSRDISRRTTMNSLDRAEDVVAILASIVPTLPKVLVENDRVLSAAGTIAANVIGPAFRAKGFPETVTHSTLELLQELARLPNNQKTWKKDVGDAFNDGRFFGTGLPLVQSDWLPLLRQWTLSDKDRMPDILARISPPTTAGIVFGVGATSARLEADRKTQLNLRRVATLVLAASEDTFVSDLPTILEKLVELLGATSTSSPSSSTRSDIFMVVRALVLRTSAIHLALMWPIINAELHSAISSVVAPDHSSASETYNNISILQACKLLDLLICVAPDDFQLHEWLFITDTIDAVYRASNYQPVALVDELSEELGQVAANSAFHNESAAHLAASSSHRRPLLGAGGIKDEVTIDRKDELVAKILRPFFGQLSIFAFESTYAMAPLDLEFCIEGLLKDVFDERTIVRAL